MRSPRKLALLCALLMTTGCQHEHYAPPEAPMTPNTVLISQMLRELSALPGFTEMVLQQLGKGSEKERVLLTPALVDEMLKRILGKDWQGLARFPGWTMREINPTVRVVGHVAGKSPQLEATAAVHPGSPAASSPAPSAPAPAADDEQVKRFLDLGPYALDKSEVVSLDQPSTLPGFTTDGLVTTLGAGVTRGDGPNDLAPEHAESQRLADVLNRLAANQLAGTAQFLAGFRLSVDKNS